MSIDLSKAKAFLRIEHDEENELIQLYIDAANEYIAGACGAEVDMDSARAELIACMLVSDFYETRTAYGSGSYARSISTMLTQLELETLAKGKGE